MIRTSINKPQVWKSPLDLTGLKTNLHYGAGVRALLWLALTDEKGSITFASQHFLSLGALDVAHVPGTLVMVGWALIFFQWERAEDAMNKNYQAGKKLWTEQWA